jgi:hypothetical protein
MNPSRQPPPLELRFLAGAALVLYASSALVILGAIVAAPPHDPGFYFEGPRIVNDYSGVLLFTCALISTVNYLLARDFASSAGVAARLRTFWALAVCGFLMLAADEFAEFHGAINVAITHTMLGFRRNPAMTRLDALVLVAYGAGALAVLARFRRELTMIPGFGLLTAVAGSFATISVAVDLLATETAASLYVEEGSKVLAASTLTLMCLTAASHGYFRIRAMLGSTREGVRAARPSTEAAPRARRSARAGGLR